MKKILALAELPELVGREIAVSDWMLIDQDRIEQFAEATGDRQWIHVDTARCRRESPSGTTIAHGLLTLSLVPALMQETIELLGIDRALNYGLNKVRFPEPVPAGSRLRGRFTLAAIEAFADSVQATWQVIIEREGAGRPACVAECLARYYPTSA